MVLTALAPAATTAQTPQSAEPRFGIIDNSFLVEEAFNQDPGVFQNIASFRWQRDQWVGTFTQEWPLGGRTHQFSYTVPFGMVDAGPSVGDVFVNYRFQLWEEGNRRPALAPRVSISLPLGDSQSGLGAGGTGWQVALPFSKQSGNLYLHWNAGVTYVPNAVREPNRAAGVGLLSGVIAASCIWQLSQTVNVMFEGLYDSTEGLSEDGTAERSEGVTISPGVRKAWNGREKQVVFGLAVPLTWSDSRTDLSLLTYISYELRFRK